MISSLLGRLVVLCALVSLSVAFAETKANHLPTMNGDQVFHGVKNQVMHFTLAGASDADQDELSYELIKSENFGELKNCLQGTANLKCEFVPNPDFRGVATFKYKANDGTADSSNSSKVTLRYDLNNHAPSVGVEREYSGATDKVLTFTIPQGRDADDDKIFYQLVSHNGAGTISGCFNSSESRVCEYHPISGHNETVTILYKAFDGIAFSEENAQIILRLGTVNHAPTMNGDQTFTSTKFTLAGASDEDGDSVTYRLVSPSTLPGLQGCLNGTSKLNCEYVPSANERGEVVFTYRANDTKENSKNVATVRLKLGENTNASPLAQMSCEQKSRRLTCHSTSSDSDGTISKTEWILNGETIVGTSFTRILPSDGSYKVSLKVWDNEGAQASLERSHVLYNNPPQINLSCLTNGSSVNCDAGLSYDPDGQIEKYEWDFADGTTESGVNALHTYAAPGSYLISVKVFDDMGDYSTATYQVQISPNQVPDVKFSCTTKSRMITCTSQSSDPDGAITKEEWLVENKLYEGSNLSHLAGQDGNVIVKLTVWDNAGAFISKEQTVDVQNALPQATISCEQSSERTYACQALNALDPDGSIASFEWFADDQKVAETQSATVSFTSSGQHFIKLKVTDDVGASIEKSYPVSIEENEEPWSSLTYQASKGSGDVTFNVMKYDAEKELRSAVLDFGDGQTLELNKDTWMEQVSHVYTNIGQYNVKIILEDNVGNRNENIISVFAGDSSLVWPYLEADAFQVAPLTLGAFAYFSYSPYYDVVEFSVDWGDGQSTTDSIPQYYRHKYTSAGEYTVTFTIKDASGRTNQKTQNYSVNSSAVEVSLPHPFPVYFKEGGFNSVVKFTSYSTSLSSLLTNALFELGDGNTQSFDLNASNQLVPSFYHVYAPGDYNPKLLVTDAEGNTNEQETNLSVVASDVYTARIRCSNIGYDVNCTVKAFSPNGTLQGASVSWGDGVVESLSDIAGTFYKKKITHHYESGGAKTVKLEISDSANPIKTDKRTVNLPATIENPAANFDCGQQGRKLYCGSTSTVTNGELVEFVWELGDGQTAYGPFLEHDFAQDGNFTVKLIVKDSLGLESQIEKTITVSGNIPPTANMSCMVNVGSVNCDGGFSYDPDGYIVKYEWDLGDGTLYEGQNANHSYQNAGQYTVTLKVTDNLGAQSVWTQTFQIAQNQPPVISEFVCFNNNFDLHCNYAAYDTDGSVKSLSIEWGDGVTDNSYDHHYNSTGTYTLKVTAVDDLNAVTQQQKEVPVYVPPVANINCSINTINVSCDSITSYSPNGMIVESRWDWGDNNQSTGDNVNHTYSASGPYTIRLTVKDNLGFEGTSIYNVNVLENHPPVIYAQNCTVTSQKINCAMSAYEYDYGDYVKRMYWIVDGVGEFEGPNLNYVFPNAGSFNVTAVAIDSFGVEERRTETYEIQMNQPPIAQVNCSTGEWSIQCWNESSDPEGRMQESYMVIDGERIDETFISKKYTEDKVLKVDVYAVDDLGVTSSLSKYINVKNILPVVDFECSFPKVLTANCYFKTLFDSDGEIAKVEWEVDGTVFETSNPRLGIQPRFDVGGIHNIAATIHDGSGGVTRKDLDIDVIIHRSPNGLLIADQEIGPPPLAVKFEVSDPVAYDDAEIVSYDWKFSNGETGTGQTVNKTFDIVGRVTASVTIKDSLGYVVTLTKEVFVENAPQLKITTDKNEGLAELSVAFSATESVATDTAIDKFKWYFGDGQYYEGETASHTYSVPGTYSVTLEAYDNIGAVTSTQTTIKVLEPPLYFTSTPPDFAISEERYSYLPSVKTATETVLTYSLEQGPEGMLINSQTGEIQWTPNNTETESYFVALKVMDGFNNEFRQRFEVRSLIAVPYSTQTITVAEGGRFEIKGTRSVLDGMVIEIPKDGVEKDTNISLRLIKGETGISFYPEVKLLKKANIIAPENEQFNEETMIKTFFSERDQKSLLFNLILIDSFTTGYVSSIGHKFITAWQTLAKLHAFDFFLLKKTPCPKTPSVEIKSEEDQNDKAQDACSAIEKLGGEYVNTVYLVSIATSERGYFHYLADKSITIDTKKARNKDSISDLISHEYYHAMQCRAWGENFKTLERYNTTELIKEATAQIFSFLVNWDSTKIREDYIGSNTSSYWKRSFHLNGKLNNIYSLFPFVYYFAPYDYHRLVEFAFNYTDTTLPMRIPYKSTDNGLEYTEQGVEAEAYILDKFLDGNLSEKFLSYIHTMLGERGKTIFATKIEKLLPASEKRNPLPNNKTVNLAPLEGQSYQIDLNAYGSSVMDHVVTWKIAGEVSKGKVALYAVLCNQGDGPKTYSECSEVTGPYHEYDSSEDIDIPFAILKNSQGKYPHLIISVINPVWRNNENNVFKLSFSGTRKDIPRITRKDYFKKDIDLTSDTIASGVPVTASTYLPGEASVEWFCNEAMCGSGNNAVLKPTTIGNVEVRGVVKFGDTILFESKKTIKVIPPTPLTIEVPIYQNITYGNCPAKSEECHVEGTFRVIPSGAMYFKDDGLQLCRDAIAIDAMDDYGNIGSGTVGAATTIKKEYPLKPVQFADYSCVNTGCPHPDEGKSCGVSVDVSYYGFEECGLGPGTFEVCSEGACRTGSISKSKLPKFYSEIFWNPGKAATAFDISVKYQGQNNTFSGTCQ